MLEERIYSRKELYSIFNTERLDAIKAKIARQGYTFQDIGRGQDYAMKILATPQAGALKVFCIEQLGFDKNIDEKKLGAFLKNVLCNEGFINLQINEMVRELNRQGISICDKTLSKYLSHIEKLLWISKCGYDFIYYVFDKKEQRNKYISKEEYQAMYSRYWNTVREDKSFDRADKEILEKYGNKPKKRYKKEINGIYSKYYNELMKLL